MSRKYKVATGILVAALCLLFGCERREHEESLLLLSSKEDDPLMEEIPNAPAESTVEGSKTSSVSSGEGILAAVTAAHEKEQEQEQKQEQKQELVVHICGAVEHPGVYLLPQGSRIYQAVEAAGGFRQDAGEDYLNQAQLLFDGMKVYVPTSEEVSEQGGSLLQEMGQEGIIGAIQGSSSALSGSEDSGLVNINTASEELLCTLSGIGPGKAKSIIAYREQNGAFRSIEEIMNVEGIKEGLFARIRDSITV